MARILLTGGECYLGACVLKALLNAGQRPRRIRDVATN